MKRALILSLAGLLLLALFGFGALYSLSWSFRHDCQVLMRIGLVDLSMSWNRGGETVTLRSDGLAIAGEEHHPSGETPYAAVLLVPASSPYGRKLGLYRLIGRGLAERGHLVLSLDVRGFGDSDDPRRLDSAEEIDALPDVLAGLELLASRPDVDPDRIHLLGHSLGGELVLRAVLHTTIAKKVVTIGPPRRTLERVEQELPGLRQRFSHDRRLDALVPERLMAEITRSWAIENLLDYYGSNDHPPVLLIDGALEAGPDLKFLRDYYDRMSPPKEYVTIPDTAHYLGTANFFGGPVVWYDRELMGDVLDLVDRWLRDSGD